MSDILVRIDRVQIVSWAAQGRTAPRVKGFKVTRDSFVRSQTNIPTYERCRHYQSKENDAKIFWQYWRRQLWLKPRKITMVADDSTGLSYDEIDAVLRHCNHWHFLTVEVAIDFSHSTGVNRNFIRRHALLGKSQRRRKHQTDVLLYFGTRKSDKFVRCYEKKEVDSYRVELELHSQLLRREKISTLDDFEGLIDTIYPRHLRFVDVDWHRLERHLRRKRHGTALIAGAQHRAASLSRLRHYLRRHGVANFHRFQAPLAINKKIDRAITTFFLDFKEMP
jgi:hypothetical protein